MKKLCKTLLTITVLMSHALPPLSSMAEGVPSSTFTVTDAETDSPISDATVNINLTQKTATCTTTQNGTCTIDKPSDWGRNNNYQYKISKSNYTAKQGYQRFGDNVSVKLTPEKKITFTGTVYNASSDTPAEYATIQIGSQQHTTSDEHGRYSITIQDMDQISPKTITVSYISCTTHTQDIASYLIPQNRNKTVPLDITIECTTRMDDIVVIGTNIRECTSDSIEVGYINPDQDHTRTCRPKQCRNEYTLMTQDKKKPDTSEYDATGEDDTLNDINTKLNWWNANLQCVQTNNCAPATNGIKSSKYELVNNTYICKVTCHNGHETDSSGTSCHELTGDCTDTLNDGNIKSAEWRGTGAHRHCEVTECKCGYDINEGKNGCDTLRANECSRQTRIDGATSVKRICVGETEICHANACDTSKYELVERTNHTLDAAALNTALRNANINTKLQTCVKHERKCTDAQKAANQQNLANAQEWTLINNDDTTGSQICIPTKCKCGYNLDNADSANATCTKWPDRTPCSERPENAADDKYYRSCRGRNKNIEYCHIEECINGYHPNEDYDRCVIDRQSGECTPDNKDNVRYAKWQKKKGEYVCIITECVRGYEPNDAGTECVAKIVLPEEQSAERINELQGVYNEAKANEKSDANKMLGGASMGATGAGGMMLGMGLAEQKADNAAYEQMRGYVSTFKCNYGANNIEYSVEPTQLPTSTELTNLYAEYVTLANDLKMRKSVLGLRAGLESQPILDSATSGLYDDVSSGRETGTFTSLARAILDPDGEDAKRWAEQTQKSKNLIIAGGVTAGVGAVGGIVGNVLINKDAPNLQSVREDINEINQKYEPQKQQFGNANSNPPPSPNPDDTSDENEGS